MRALSNISNPKYTLLVKWWGHPSSIVDKYMYNNIGNTLKFHYYYTNCWIDMMELYDQLHSIHNRPTKHESNRTNNTRGVVFTRYNYNANAWKRESPITSTEIIESKWRDNMIMTNHSANITERMNGQTAKLCAPILSYARHKHTNLYKW